MNKANKFSKNKRVKKTQANIPQSIKKTNRNFTVSSLFNKENLFYSSSVIVIVSSFLFFSLLNLGKFIWTDGPVLWYFNWVPEFWEGLKTMEWEHLSKEFSYPGLPTMFLSGMITQNFVSIEDYGPENFHVYMFWMRFPLVIFNFISILIIYVFSSRLWNKHIALFILVLSALHPLTIGISQFVLGDSIMWSTLFISVLSYFLYLKTVERKYIYFTGVFFSLTVLSKFAGLILYPIFFLILVFEYFFNKFSVDETKQRLKGLFRIYFVYFISCFIFYPQTWSDLNLLFYTTFWHASIVSIRFLLPILILIFSLEIFVFKGKISKKIIEKINLKKLSLFLLTGFTLLAFILVFLNKYTGLLEFDLDLGTYGRTQTGNFITALYLPFSSLPEILTWLMFYSLIGALVMIFFKLKKDQCPNYIFHLLFIYFSFSMGAAIGGFKTWWKYQIIFIPIISSLIGLVYLNLFKKQYKVTIVLVFIFSIAEVIIAYPGYFRYKNSYYPLAKINNKYDGNTGGYELAQKLNNIDGADTIKVLSDTFGFMYYFKGENILINNEITHKDILNCDYLFLSTFGKNEKLNWKILPYSIFSYYNQPLDSAFAYKGNKNSYAKLVKVDKKRQLYTPDNYFHTDYYINLNSNNTLSFWIKTENENAGSILSFGRNSNDLSIFEVSNNSLYITQNKQQQKISKVISDGNWHNVQWLSTARGKLASQQLYIDGELVSDYVIKIDKKAIKAIFLNNQFKGEIDDVRIYHQLLKKNQIKIVYNNGRIQKERILESEGEKFYPVRHFSKQK